MTASIKQKKSQQDDQENISFWYIFKINGPQYQYLISVGKLIDSSNFSLPAQK